jgi:hypothetical protein
MKVKPFKDTNTESIIKMSDIAKASTVFRESVAAQFELENDFLDTITELFVKAASTISVSVEQGSEAPKKGAKQQKAGAAEVAAAAKRAPRKKSAYNVYVREMMKSSDVQALDHKQKMGAIASSWNALTEEQKKVYTDLANNENVETE